MSGKGDRVAQGYRTPQWENSKLWDKKNHVVQPNEKAHIPDARKMVKKGERDE